MKNPNANVAGLTFAVSEAVTFIAKHYTHLHLSNYWSQAITGALVYAVLFVGRDGIKGALARVLNGSKVVWSGQAVAKK